MWYPKRKQIKNKIKSFHSGYSDYVIRTKDIQFQSFQLRMYPVLNLSLNQEQSVAKLSLKQDQTYS